MSFDLYVGSFTRYISGDWENAGQREAREKGHDYKLIRDNETEEAPPPTEEILATVEEWRDAINAGLQEQLKITLAWDESKEAPYATARPYWHGYAAMLLLAAHDDNPDDPRPEKLPEEWGEDPAYKKSTDDDGETRYPTILLADLWLPGDFDFMFGLEDLGGNPRAVASLAALREELAELNRRTINATPEQLAEWAKKNVGEDASFIDQASFGLALMTAMSDEAQRLQLPLMPDY